MPTMHRIKLIALFAAVVAAPALFALGIYPASASYERCARWAQAQLDPDDLEVMQESVSASARLAVAIRLRALEAQCRAAAHHRIRKSG
jgi:hypothetical protein